MKQWQSIIRLLLIGSLLSGFSVCAAEAEMPLPQIQKGVLSNGLQYTLVPLSGQKKRVDIRLVVNVGSLDEEDDQSGVAHMVEHMVFRASDAFPQGIASSLHQRGWVRAQHYNAMTNYERTLYMMSPPAGAGDLAGVLQALSQMVGHARLLQSDLDDERRIILEEWRGKLGVAERMNQQRVQAIRHDSRYPQRQTIGTEAAIRNTPATTLQAFYQRWYHPGNMRLLIIGDIQPAEVERQIAHYFADQPAVALPARDYYEPNLSPRLKVVRLQDSQSGSSQVSWVMRFNPGSLSVPERLMSQITISALSRQMRRQQTELPPEVGSLVVRKQDIGKTTQALGLFADVMPDGHQVAQGVLLRELERIRRYGLSEQDIATEKQAIREVAQRMADKPEQREFADWVRVISTVWLQGRDYVGSQQRGRQVLSWLDGITAQQVNRQLQQWLSASDTLMQFSVPGLTPFTLPTTAAIQQQRRQIALSDLAPPQRNDAQVIAPSLAAVDAHGQRSAVKTFPAQQTEEWALSNGDRLVWLRTPLAKERVRLTGISNAGFMTPGLNPWQAQLASQLVAQSGPQGWQGEQLSAWLKQKSLSLSINQQAEWLQMEGQAKPENLADLLALSRALQVTPGIDEQVMKESLMRLLRQKTTQTHLVTDDRAQQIRLLRYGQPGWRQPDSTQLKQLQAALLLEQWRISASAPMTWYLLADLPSEQLQPLVERYLASVPRQPMAIVKPELPRAGSFNGQSAVNIEPRADVKAWSFTSLDWTPQAAVQVSIARNLANQALKASLRDDALGIYRLRMNSELEDRHQRIETEISFTSAPQRAQELWQRATTVFDQLPQQITQQQVDEQRHAFIRAEHQRQQDISTLQRRLLLSYRHYNDPRYLTDVATLAESITLPQVQAMAARLFNPHNQVVHISLPQQQVKP
ncbi:insulinase family protein [Erwinia sp. V71]|uniref:M16 family metallopeptidase n=1 Tax=Erwinia sp. V71 TaxID=3369424 RepID=UPI003F63C9A0